MIDWGRKFEGEVITVGWEPPLQSGEAISSFTPTLESGTISLSGASFADGAVALQITGGTAGEVAIARLLVDTSEGQTLETFARITIKEDASADVVTVPELREFLRDPPDADDVLLSLITSAREMVETQTGLCLIQRTETLVLDRWPGGPSSMEWWDGVRDGAIGMERASYVELPLAPLISVDHVHTFTALGSPVIFPASNYYLDTVRKPGRLALNSGATWPITERRVAGIVIQYQCGFTPDKVPQPLKLATLQLAAHWYENREAASLEAVHKMPLHVQRIIGGYRVVKL